jgi:hypothetical protein
MELNCLILTTDAPALAHRLLAKKYKHLYRNGDKLYLFINDKLYDDHYKVIKSILGDLKWTEEEANHYDTLVECGDYAE